MSWISTYQGSVNRWECDENDHQNVRFYLTKVNQGLLIALQKWCLADHDDCGALLARARHHHIRFLREARVAVPQTIDCGMLSFTPGVEMTVLSIMRNATSGEVLATFTSGFDLSASRCAPFSSDLVELPLDASPKGVASECSPYADLDYAQALEHGFAELGAGVIANNECDANGQLETQHYIGRISDGMPNLWGMIRYEADADDPDAAFSGGAVLEYRLNFHRALRAGDSFVHLGGINSMGRKTHGVSHLLYHAPSGQLAASAQALGIAMDLDTRRSMEIPPQQRARIEKLMLRSARA